MVIIQPEDLVDLGQLHGIGGLHLDLHVTLQQLVVHRHPRQSVWCRIDAQVISASSSMALPGSPCIAQQSPVVACTAVAHCQTPRRDQEGPEHPCSW